MKILKVVYDDNTKFILDIVSKYSIGNIIEEFSLDDYRQRKKAIPIMTRHGTKEVPLIVFEDENLQEYTAIWSEQNPDWDEEINKKLNTDESKNCK